MVGCVLSFLLVVVGVVSLLSVVVGYCRLFISVNSILYLAEPRGISF